MRNLLVVALLTLPARAADRLVIAALGDSLTHGYGLPQGTGFVPQLQLWLDAHSPVPVTLVNAGVSGDTTAGGLARLDWVLAPEIGAVIVELGGNDLLRGIDPAETRKNLDAILAILQARHLPVLLVGLPGPANYGPDWKAAFDAIYPELAAKYGARLYPDFLAVLGRDPAAALPFLQADAIHPNEEGVRRIVGAIGPVVLNLIAAARAARS
jgi:acyl-CoA thioesterase I